jgi:hypothetical protein
MTERQVDEATSKPRCIVWLGPDGAAFNAEVIAGFLPFFEEKLGGRGVTLWLVGVGCPVTIDRVTEEQWEALKAALREG